MDAKRDMQNVTLSPACAAEAATAWRRPEGRGQGEGLNRLWVITAHICMQIRLLERPPSPLSSPPWGEEMLHHPLKDFFPGQH